MPADIDYPFADLKLARRLERTEASANAHFVEARARAMPEVGAAWMETAGAFAMFDGADSPLTQTFGLGIFEPVTPEVLDDIERFFRERNAPVFHEVSPLAQPDLLPLLNAHRYHPVEFTSVMFRPIAAGVRFAVPRNERVRARPIQPGEEETWAQTSVRGWASYPEYAPFILDLGRIITQREDGISFLAELDGEVIAAGSLSMHEGVALLGGSSTVPERRKQGAQAALLDARLRYGVNHGCDLAMMCAAPGSSSQRNAERQGFRIAYTRVKWGLTATEA